MSRRVLVTGSSRGIGKSIALQLAQDGFHVTVHCRSGVEQANETIEQIQKAGGSANLIQFDIADRKQTRSALEIDIEQHGAYYGVVCNAGITRDGAFPALTDSDWDDVIHTNLDGFYNVVHPLVMPMVRNKKGGRIVAMSSVSGVLGNRGQVNYSASKAGLIGATKALAVELARRKITVNCVAPGLIETDMIDDEITKEAMKVIPARRMGKPEEIAGLVSYLFSDTAGYLTRQVISVNGGMA
ncbi:3-ketoacyl-ACP reductase FabG2 [Kangiella sediminilitoris]|uniref:3-ketoacyl-ACP reductase FabG2 n=1 Tax=Kangiella sediminilitoris TaxID=1144748 RepID=UPI00083E3949|nr:3-ketoacyl-ACP reductase FabG2 [Kangiella sediminilitoris]